MENIDILNIKLIKLGVLMMKKLKNSMILYDMDSNNKK